MTAAVLTGGCVYCVCAVCLQTVEEAGEVIYTYDVEWRQSDVTWSHRWDVYFTGNPDDEIHYFSIVNSLMIVLFLTGTTPHAARHVARCEKRREG